MSGRDPGRQLWYLFISNFAILFVGMGLFPLLPLYAGEFGASSTTVGVYLAITYVSITVGTMLTGWLAERLTHKVMFVAAGLLGLPALVLLGQASALWQIVVLTGTVWFSGGIGLALISVLAGLFADENSRGRSFGLLSLAGPLGAVVGGTVIGQLVEWQGYPLMFVALAVVWAAWPVVALFKVSYEPGSATTSQANGTRAGSLRPGKVFNLLLVAALLAAMTMRVGRLGLSLSMDANQFSAGAISGANVVGGLVTIPVVLWFGTLSDRLGRKRFLAFSYLVAAGGALSLSAAHQLWQFWLAGALLLVATTTSGSVASAYATDLLAPEALSRGLPWLQSTSWVAGILGFGGGGYMMETLGAASLFMITGLFALLATALLGLLPGRCPVVGVGRSSLGDGLKSCREAMA